MAVTNRNGDAVQMSDMFALAMPWWEFILRAVVVYVVVLGMVRLTGKRALGQVTPFDVLLIVLLGNAVQNALLGQDTSLAGGLLLAATLIALNYGVGWLTTRNRRMERLIEGEPVLVARDGRLLDSVLRRELITQADFDAALRQQGCRDVEEVELALLEINGHITIVPRRDAQARAP
jgi:uncharacterized membrane protein YcaP (DUF421 family)